MADANKKKLQLEAERKKNDKERKDLENEIALLRSDLYSGSKSLLSGRSVEEVGANDGRDDFDGTDAESLARRRDLPCVGFVLEAKTPLKIWFFHIKTLYL